MNWKIVTLISVIAGIVGVLSWKIEETEVRKHFIYCLMAIIVVVLLLSFIYYILKPSQLYWSKKQESELKIWYEEKMMELNKKYKENITLEKLNKKIEALEKNIEELKK